MREFGHEVLGGRVEVVLDGTAHEVDTRRSGFRLAMRVRSGLQSIASGSRRGSRVPRVTPTRFIALRRVQTL